MEGSTNCRDGLAALAGGRWGEWRGLGPDCTRAAAEEAVGPTVPEPDGSGSLAGSPTAFRIYPPAPAAPHGIQLWLDGDRILLVQINSPDPGGDPEELLGPPEATLPSRLAARHQQWVYASRGLTLHVHARTHEVRRLYGYPPSSAEEFAQSPLARVELQRVPR
ncbi:MAG: hypothetical protein ACRDPC_27215 [Solirubrobacteraceae bacterium]